MFHYLFNVLCFQFRVISVEYYYNECTLYEINDLIDNLPYLDRNMWESSRLGAYITAQVNSRKKLSMRDICEFKWEKEDINEEKIVEMSNNDIERLKNLAKQWED